MTGSRTVRAESGRVLAALPTRRLLMSLVLDSGALVSTAGLADVIDARVVFLAADGDEVVTVHHDDLQQLAAASRRHVEVIRP